MMVKIRQVNWNFLMIKVFVIDDSATVRNAFSKIFSSANDIELIGKANNPVDAFNIFKKVGLPDVFILDIEMPKMDGLAFLQKINQQRPIPVIMCSTLVSKGSSAAIDALRMGAVDIVQKPTFGLKEFFSEKKEELLDSVRAAANSKVHFNFNVASEDHTIINTIKEAKSSFAASKKIVAIGSSTGGVQVIEEIVLHLNPNHPAIVITQHMPVGFTASFAERLNMLAQNSNVKEAQEGDILLPGRVLIAPGDKHLEVKKQGTSYVATIKDYPKVNSHKPSVNVLFSSMAKEVGKNGVGFILTGMGDDGAVKLKAMKDAGAKTYAQNEKSCTVYGMPRRAVEIDAVYETMNIMRIVSTINNLR